jgi:hypothetical protein
MVHAKRVTGKSKNQVFNGYFLGMPPENLEILPLPAASMCRRDF